MPDTRIAVEAPREADTPAVLDLIAAQERWWRTHQPLIAPPRDQESIAAQISAHRRDSAWRPLVARDSAGEGARLCPTHLLRPPGGERSARLFQGANGTVAALALPPPEDATAATCLPRSWEHWTPSGGAIAARGTWSTGRAAMARWRQCSGCRLFSPRMSAATVR